jgi:hypothetical protein
MHSYLITGGTEKEREEEIAALVRLWRVSAFDQIRLPFDPDAQSIGISDIRTLIGLTRLTPRVSPLQAVIIANAHTMTIEAQHALLKTLEEPPSRTRIILATDQPASLLPTIVSRCQEMRLKTALQPGLTDIKTCTEKKGKSYGEICRYVDRSFTGKELAKKFFDESLTSLVALLHDPTTGEKNETGLTLFVIRTLIKNVIRGQALLHAHVNYKLVLDEFFFHFLSTNEGKIGYNTGT